MKNKYIYPAIFHPEDDGGYSISFPDLDGCFTQGDDIEDALYMAWDAAAGWLITAQKSNEDIPGASSIKSIQLESEDDFVNLIAVDLLEYKKQNKPKSVKKTLSIPLWLNEEAENRHINFSSVLQQALKEQLNI